MFHSENTIHFAEELWTTQAVEGSCFGSRLFAVHTPAATFLAWNLTDSPLRGRAEYREYLCEICDGARVEGLDATSLFKWLLVIFRYRSSADLTDRSKASTNGLQPQAILLVSSEH